MGYSNFLLFAFNVFSLRNQCKKNYKIIEQPFLNFGTKVILYRNEGIIFKSFFVSCRSIIKAALYKTDRWIYRLKLKKQINLKNYRIVNHCQKYYNATKIRKGKIFIKKEICPERNSNQFLRFRR